MDVSIAAPRELLPPDDVIYSAEGLAIDGGARVLVTDDAARGVDGVTSSTPTCGSAWASPTMTATRVPGLLPYRVTAALMTSAGRPDTKFMHCLPALHNPDTELGRRLYEQFGSTTPKSATTSSSHRPPSCSIRPRTGSTRSKPSWSTHSQASILV